MSGSGALGVGVVVFIIILVAAIAAIHYLPGLGSGHPAPPQATVHLSQSSVSVTNGAASTVIFANVSGVGSTGSANFQVSFRVPAQGSPAQQIFVLNGRTGASLYNVSTGSLAEGIPDSIPFKVLLNNTVGATNPTYYVTVNVTYNGTVENTQTLKVSLT